MWSNELEDDEFITDFVCLGAKNYSYKTNKERLVCKIKGFTLNYETALILNYDAMCMLLNEREGSILTTNDRKITLHKTSSLIYNKPEIKKYRAVFTKRQLTSSLGSIPFGF